MTRTGENDGIEVEALRTLLDEGRRVRILDIRSPEEFAEWRIPGSERLAVEEEDGALRARARPDGPDAAPTVVVCQRGRSSRDVARDLRSRFGIDARSLEGGMAAWSRAWNVARVPDPRDPVEVVQLRRTGKGCLSYLVGAGPEAVVIDPSLDPDLYLDEAEARGWTIAAVLDTHIHADHISRARVLAGAADARLLLPRQERARFPHESVDDGDAVRVGPVALRAHHTPGHTGESLSYLVDDRFLFTGDTLFVESVGRPDLESAGGRDEVRRRARTLHGSLARLTGLGADVVVLPGHAGGPVPFDGEPIAAPLGEVRKRTHLLGLDEDAFVERLLERIPPTPPNHAEIVELNEEGAYPEAELEELEAGANRCAAT